MPNIPRKPISTQTIAPSAQPSVFGAASTAQAGVGQALTGAARQVGSAVQAVQEREARDAENLRLATEKANRALNAVRLDNDVKNQFATSTEQLNQIQDPNQIQEFVDELSLDDPLDPGATVSDPALQAAYEKVRGSEQRKFQQTANVKKADLITKEYIGLVDQKRTRNIQQSAIADPQERFDAQNDYFADIDQGVERGIYDLGKANDLKSSYIEGVETARVMIDLDQDAEATKTALENHEYNFDDPVTEQEMINTAETKIKSNEAEARIAKNELKSQQKEAEKKRFDTAQNEINGHINAKNPTQAAVALGRSLQAGIYDETAAKPVYATIEKLSKNEQFPVDNIAHGNMQMRVNTDPTTTVDDIWNGVHIDKSYGPKEAEILQKRWESVHKDTTNPQTKQEAAAFKSLQLGLINGWYGNIDPEDATREEVTRNQTMYVTQVGLLQNWIELHPNEDPAPYIAKVLEPAAKEWSVMQILKDTAAGALSAATLGLVNIRSGEKGIGFGQVRADKTNPDIPDKSEWLKAAKISNPNETEDDLSKFYDDKYGTQ